MNNFSPAARTLLVMAAFVVVVGAIKLASDLVIPLMLSVFIALVVSPLLRWFKKLGMPSGLAIVLVLVLLSLSGLLLVAVVGSSVNDFRDNLPLYTERLKLLSAEILTWFTAKGVEIDSEQWSSIFNPGMVMQFFGKTLASLGSVMSNILMILFTVLFILTEEVGFADKLTAARGDEEASKGITHFSHSLNSYMAIKTIISLVTGFIVLIGTWVMGLDYPALWGMLAFLLNFIPTVGSIIAAVPAVLLAIIQLGMLEAGIIATIYLVANFVMGKGLNLSTFVVWVSLIFWGWVLGPVGMLLSVPLTIMIKIAMESHEETRWIGILLGASVPENTRLEIDQEVENLSS